MSFEYLVDPRRGPQWRHLLPGRPEPYVLRRGEGEHAMLFTDLFSTDHNTPDQPPFVPDLPRMQAAARQHTMRFLPDVQWPDA